MTSWEDTTADPGVPYYYMVEACSECGCSEAHLGDPGYRGFPPLLTTRAYLPLVLR
jgi:hypothetical protein